MIDNDEEELSNNKICFRCGKWDPFEKWRKRQINGEWDGKNYFCNACNFRQGRPLTDEQKIVTLSLTEIRAFSNISCVDIRKPKVRKELKDVIDITYKKLKEWDLIKLKIDDLYNKAVLEGEDPVSNLFKSAYLDLQEMTIGLAKNYNRVCYLDVFDERLEIFKDNINSLFRLIVYDAKVIYDKGIQNCVRVSNSKNDIFHYSEELESLCLEISDSNGAYIFNNTYEHIFSSPKYDNIMSSIIKYEL